MKEETLKRLSTILLDAQMAQNTTAVCSTLVCFFFSVFFFLNKWNFSAADYLVFLAVSLLDELELSSS